MTIETGKAATGQRRVFTPEHEKPVAIYLPQHQPGRARGPSLPVIASAFGTVALLGASLSFMMPADMAPKGSASAEVAAATTTATGRDAYGADTSADGAEVLASAGKQEPAGDTAAVQSASAASATTASTSTTPASATDIPASTDPRWARIGSNNGSAALEAVRKLMVEKAAQPEDEAPSDLMAYAAEGAGTIDGEVRRPMQIVLPAELPEQPEAATRTTAVRAAVNMRSGPSGKNGVILVIPRNASVELFECSQWCKVAYNGRTGYIYKSFIGSGGSARAPEPKKAKSVAVVSTVEKTETSEEDAMRELSELQRARR